MAILTSMVAGAMVFSSFVAPKQGGKTIISEITVNQDGWENWTQVRAYAYKRDQNNGEWFRYSSYMPLESVPVQRRAWCGDVQYRVLYRGTPYSVTNSPTDDYPYCFYMDGYAFCFYM